MVCPNDPTANDCKIVDYRGEKIAAFMIGHKTMLCLPQVFELFLKNLVGGLHTVYTKCKRLELSPMICNVEQVRDLSPSKGGLSEIGNFRCECFEAWAQSSLV